MGERRRKSKLPLSFSPETSSGGIFSDDIISEFLLRLPVESLVRCKSVSKTWISLISDPNFIRSHLTRSITTAGAEKTMMVENCKKFSIFRMSSSEFDHYSEGAFPFEADLVVGSACGIVCVFVRECRSTAWWCNHATSLRLCDCKTEIYLWNPATRRCKTVPWLHFCERKLNGCSGFGFDPISNSFKIVRVVQYITTVFSLVFSTNMSHWHKVDWPYGYNILCGENCDVCMHGYMYFRTYSGTMVAFDLNKEVFVGSVKLPDRTYIARIIDYNDSVSFIYPETKEMNDVIKLWTLDDEACLRGGGGGVEASWTLMLSIDVPMRVHNVRDYFSSGDLLLMSEHKWYLYNSDKKETRAVPVPVCEYAESLVSIANSKPVTRLLQ